MATANNKKPAASAKPVKLASVKAPTPNEDDDLDTEGDDEDGDEKKSKLPMPKRLAVRIKRMGERLAPYANRLDAWPNVGDVDMKVLAANLANAMSGLVATAAALASLPDDYSPRIVKASTGAKGGGSKAELTVGCLVRVTDKQRGDYAGVLEDALLGGMTVIENRGNRVFVKLGDGTVGMFPRGHVTIDAQ